MSARRIPASDAAHEPEKGPQCLPLSSLKPGIRARLCDHSETTVSTRLLDLGLVPDTSLVVVRTAPLGDPFEVELRGYRLCLRRADVESLCVSPEAPTR